MSGEEKQFTAFWLFVFGSAIGFWVVVAKWLMTL
jgi:hypothetical protein